MTKKIDYDYYEWLISQINVPRGKTFNGLFEILHNTEFVWIVPHDDNRSQDGLDLRSEFLHGRKNTLELGGVTMLEIVVSLSRRLAFIASGHPKNWSWRLIKNLRLNMKDDPLSDEDVAFINEVLYSLIWRTYQRDGRGGFFPLSHPDEDQTKVEIWYQMNKYVIEKNAV